MKTLRRTRQTDQVEVVDGPVDYGHSALVGRAFEAVAPRFMSRAAAREGDLEAMSSEPAWQGASAVSVWSAAAHDLHQPMQGLRLLTGAMAAEADEAARRRIGALVEVALASLQRMLDLLSEIAKLEAHDAAVAVVPYKIDGILAQIAAELHPLAAQKSGSITASDCTITTALDRNMLGEAIRGLTLHLMGQNPTAQINIAARIDGAHTIIEVAAASPPAAGPAAAIGPPGLFIEQIFMQGENPALAVGLGLRLVEHVAGVLGLVLVTSPLPDGGTAFLLRTL